MNKLVPISSPALPAIVAAAGERASMRFLEFFAASIRNPHTRRAYGRAAEEFLAWCASAGGMSSASMRSSGSRSDGLSGWSLGKLSRELQSHTEASKVSAIAITCSQLCGGVAAKSAIMTGRSAATTTSAAFASAAASGAGTGRSVRGQRHLVIELRVLSPQS